MLQFITEAIFGTDSDEASNSETEEEGASESDTEEEGPVYKDIAEFESEEEGASENEDDFPYEDNETLYNAVFSIYHPELCHVTNTDHLYVLVQIDKSFINDHYPDGGSWEYEDGRDMQLYYMENFLEWADLMNILLEHDDILPITIADFNFVIQHMNPSSNPDTFNEFKKWILEIENKEKCTTCDCKE